MKIIWLWVGIAFFFTIGALRVIFNGQISAEIEPVRIMNASSFDSPEQIGALIFRRFWQELNTEKIVVLGSALELSNYEKIWIGLISLNNKNNLQFDEVFEQTSLPQLDLQSQPLDWGKVAETVAKGRRVLIHVEATSKMWLEVQAKIKGGFIIFQNNLPVGEEEIESLRQGCVNFLSTQKINNESPMQKRLVKYNYLPCAGVSVAKRGKKFKINPLVFSAIIEKRGAREHMLYVREPSVD